MLVNILLANYSPSHFYKLFDFTQYELNLILYTQYYHLTLEEMSLIIFVV